MSLIDQISNLAVRVGVEFKSRGTRYTTLTISYSSVLMQSVLTDVDITPASQVDVQWSPSTTDLDENNPEMDTVRFLAIAGTGSAIVRLISDRKIGGVFKVKYTIN